MSTTPIEQTKIIVTRAVNNYPKVVMELSNEVKNQLVATGKEIYSLLRLSVKTVGIVTFPVWIVPVALVMCLTIHVLSIQPSLTEVRAKN